jgi:cytochrome b561
MSEQQAAASGTAQNVWRNDSERFGRTSRLFHWTMALLIVATVALGLYAASFDRSDPAREPILFFHKPLGLTILFLSALRLGWILRSPPPPLPGSLKIWERRLAWLVHKLLYVLLFAMPLSGILLSQAAGKDVSFFGLFSLPQFVPVDPAVPPEQRPLVFAGYILHKVVLPWVLYLMVASHVLGVIKHHFVDGHKQFIRRMWGTR